MKLSALILVATEADFRLGELVQHLLFGIVHLMAIRARNAFLLVYTSRPVRPRVNA